MNHSTIKFLF